jgi:hypothetical protein
VAVVSAGLGRAESPMVGEEVAEAVRLADVVVVRLLSWSRGDITWGVVSTSHHIQTEVIL